MAEDGPAGGERPAGRGDGPAGAAGGAGACIKKKDLLMGRPFLRAENSLGKF